MSYPEFKATPSRGPQQSRGGYNKQWGDRQPRPSQPPRESISRKGKEREIVPRDIIDIVPDRGGDSIAGAETDEDGDLATIDPALRPDRIETSPTASIHGSNLEDQDPEKRKRRTTSQPPVEAVPDIQILDLHSEEPLISYRGKLYTGQWAEVIGTELILKSHDEANPLPTLRSLSGNVDLLGASCARLLTKEQVIKPLQPVDDSLAAIKAEWNIKIPSGKYKDSERAQQARFLEDLIAIKKQRGDVDEVTVYAKDGIGKDFRDSRDPDYRPRKRVARSLKKSTKPSGEIPNARQKRGSKTGRRSNLVPVITKDSSLEPAPRRLAGLGQNPEQTGSPTGSMPRDEGGPSGYWSASNDHQIQEQAMIDAYDVDPELIDPELEAVGQDDDDADEAMLDEQ